MSERNSLFIEADGSKADSLLTFWTRLSAFSTNRFPTVSNQMFLLCKFLLATVIAKLKKCLRAILFPLTNLRTSSSLLVNNNNNSSNNSSLLSSRKSVDQITFYILYDIPFSKNLASIYNLTSLTIVLQTLLFLQLQLPFQLSSSKLTVFLQLNTFSSSGIPTTIYLLAVIFKHPTCQPLSGFQQPSSFEHPFFQQPSVFKQQPSSFYQPSSGDAQYTK